MSEKLPNIVQSLLAQSRVLGRKGKKIQITTFKGRKVCEN